jgi:hypothetical protein
MTIDLRNQRMSAGHELFRPIEGKAAFSCNMAILMVLSRTFMALQNVTATDVGASACFISICGDGHCRKLRIYL